MSSSDVISIVGALVTVVCTWISIQQARAARRYGDALKAAKSRMALLGSAERLRAVQDPITQLPQTPTTLRGARPDATIARIRIEFDRALGSLERNGPGAKARAFLRAAEASLDLYEDSVRRTSSGDAAEGIDIGAMRAVRTAVQDAIAEIVEVTERIDP